MREENTPSTELGLASLSVRIPVQNMWFNGKTVSLDGYNFQSCRFDNCQLHLASANFEMHHCFVDDNTTIHYQGEIVKVLRLFNRGHIWICENLPYFCNR